MATALTNHCRELKLDAEYYIRRQLIPPLNRILNLIGVDCEIWYNAMPKRQLASNQHRYKSGRDQKAQGLGRTLDTAFTSIHCLVCGQVNQKRGRYLMLQGTRLVLTLGKTWNSTYVRGAGRPQVYRPHCTLCYRDFTSRNPV